MPDAGADDHEFHAAQLRDERAQAGNGFVLLRDIDLRGAGLCGNLLLKFRQLFRLAPGHPHEVAALHELPGNLPANTRSGADDNGTLHKLSSSLNGCLACFSEALDLRLGI